jgi:hypothetical protein
MTKTTVTGIAQWAKVFEENRDLDGFEGQWRDTNGRCTIDVIMDQTNFTKLTDLGMMANGKDDPEGRGKVVKFTRKFEAPHEWMGGAPAVYKSDGTMWSFDDDGVIGNGSEVLVEVDIYKNGNYSNYTTRLERVKVIKLVQPNSEGDTSDDPFVKNMSAVTASNAVEEAPVEDIPF